MNITTSRRTFLKKITLGLVVFVPATQALASDLGVQLSSEDSTPPPPLPPQRMSLIVDKYVAGEVVEVNENQIQLKTIHRGNVVLNLSPETAVWKGGWDRDLPIEIDDQIKAWGEPQGKEVFNVEKMWINIVNLLGTISNIRQESSKELQLHHHDSRRNKSHLVRIDYQTKVNQGDQERTFGDNPVDLRDGQFLQVVGLKLKDDSVLATRLLF